MGAFAGSPDGLLLEQGRTRGFPRVFPFHPIWPGFAVNTIFYAAILWVPFAPFVLRRHIRRKRGRCPQCAYDLRSDLTSGCPECGWRREAEE